MKRVTIAIFALYAFLPALMPANTQSRNRPEANRDFALERAVFARAEKLKSLLQPETRAKLDLIARGLLASLASRSDHLDPAALSRQEVRSRFAQLSDEQCNLLSFYVLAETVRTIAATNEKNGNRNDVNEMTEERSRQLTIQMESNSKFIATIRRLMSEIAATQNEVIQNMK